MQNVYTDFAILQEQDVSSTLPPQRDTTRCIGMLLNLLVYMPTLSLANTVSYNALEQYKCDLIKDFPPIRVWGTIGFICAMWAVDLTGFKNSSAQLYVGGASALLLGLYSFTLPVPVDRLNLKTNHGSPLSDWMRWCYSRKRKWLFSSFSPCF